MNLKNVNDMESLISYFSENLNWDIDLNDFDDIDDITYDFDAEDLGLKEESFAKISSLKQLRPLVDNQKWGIFLVEFDSQKFEVTALRKILSGLIPTRRNSSDHAVWDKHDLLFLCTWGTNNKITIGAAHFEDSDNGLPQIKMISCEPGVEDPMQIQKFENNLNKLSWPSDPMNHTKWQDDWRSAFTKSYKQTIRDSKTLVQELAVEAKGIHDRILDILNVETEQGYVHKLFRQFKDVLIHDMTEKQFADMYAQTLTYGLFSARCLGEISKFDISHAVDAIPNTNPFLKGLMQECLGTKGSKNQLNFDELEVYNIITVLKNTQTELIVEDFNRQTGGGKEDPVIHFYEKFLTEYDKTQKVQRGVFYTPQPVVNFMVKAVDEVLRDEFGYIDGLASAETKKIKVLRSSKKRVKGKFTEVEDEMAVPAIQILDPATGTGTYLRQIILHIYDHFCQSRKNLTKTELNRAWNQYVSYNLLPRLNGFELMMAPYAVAHMKLAMVLKETGYDFSSNKRLQVYLTNTLEEPGNANPQISLFEDPIAIESIAANSVKINKGISVIIGNPPYSAESSNNSKWINDLVLNYKLEPNSKMKLSERNYKAINDDYVKFIRLSESILNKGSFGILAFICPHGFLDNPTFRGMRWHLLKQFSKIYIIDLHGNLNKKEKTPEGTKDENVFDIQQGVCIFIGVMGHKNEGLAKVYHSELFGLRNYKYSVLSQSSLKDFNFTELYPQNNQYYLVPQSLDFYNEYLKGFSLNDLFLKTTRGVVTGKDAIFVDRDENTLKKKILEAFKNVDEDKIFPISYRPFDIRYIYYDPKLLDRARPQIMPSMSLSGNFGLVFRRQSPESIPNIYFGAATNMVSDGFIRSDNKGGESIAPLYIESTEGELLSNSAIIPNIVKQEIKKIEKSVGLKFISKNQVTDGCFTAEQLFDYILAFGYSLSYYQKYKEYLKRDFPRIPYPKDSKDFYALAQSGKKLRSILTEPIRNAKSSVHFPILGDNKIGKPVLIEQRLYINKLQYFEPVSEELWNYYLGGYQPLQKWLKDIRKDYSAIPDSKIDDYIQIINGIQELIITARDIDKIVKKYL